MEKQSSPEPSRRWPLRRPRRLRSIALLPSLITLGNGVCGVVAIFYIGLGLDTEPNRDRFFTQAAWLILLAMVFDALDGMVARMTRTASNFGAQLDSLCDLITFGVAPAFLTFAVSRKLVQGEIWERPVLAVCVLYSMCAIIRLARFTVETAPDESAHREFAGLPSPAAAGVIAASVLPWKLAQEFTWASDAIPGALPGLALATGILMVSRIRYLHIVNRLLRGNRPFVTLVELGLVGVLLFIFKEFAFFLAFFAYAVAGPMGWVKTRVIRKPAPADRAVERKPNTA